MNHFLENINVETNRVCGKNKEEKRYDYPGKPMKPTV